MSDVSLRGPRVEDGAALWELVVHTGVLDENSPYLYLLVATHFAGSSIVAELDGRLVGFISAYRLPEDPTVLFVWQVAVHSDARGRGVATRMLLGLLERPDNAGVRRIHTTVTEDNTASRRMFAGLARRLDCPLVERPFIEAHHFPGEASHDAEPLLDIGPFRQDDA